MELKELKKKSEKDLHKMLGEYRDKLRDLRFKDANKQLKDVRQVRMVRQTIARILTLLNNSKKSRKAQESDSGQEKKTLTPSSAK